MKQAVSGQPAPTGRREANKAANRAQILDAAARLFVDRGVDGVTIRDIVRGTRLAAGTFYNYFPDKQAVFRALVDDQMGQLTRRLVEIRRNASSLEPFLHDTYALVFETVLREPVFYALILRNQTVVRTLYDDRVLGVSVEALSQDIVAAQSRGLIDPALDVKLLAAALFGVGFEMARALVDRADHGQADPQAAAQLATRVFLAGIAPPS